MDWKAIDTTAIELANQEIDDAWNEAVLGYTQTEKCKIKCKGGCNSCCISGNESTAWDDYLSMLLAPSAAALLLKHIRSLAESTQIAILEREKKYYIGKRNLFEGLPITVHAYLQCPFLDDNKTCVVYEARPGVCRYFGLPISTHLNYGDNSNIACIKNKTMLNQINDSKHKVMYNSRMGPEWAKNWLKAVLAIQKVEIDEIKTTQQTIDLKEIIKSSMLID
jgi:Fe-S-cluster containining protein